MGKSKEITVTISNMEENPEKISPIIGYFSSGYNPPLNAMPKPKVTVSKNKNVRRRRNNNRYEVVVSPNEQSQVKFVGTNYSGEATAPQVSTYALGILDKSTATLKLLPITANKIFRLEPRFAELEDKEMEEVREEEKKDMYISKKNIRANKKRALLHEQHDDPEIQKDIDKKIEGLQIQINEEQITTTNSPRNIPPHDMDATSSNLIYPLNKIIFNGEWDHLMDIFDIGTTNNNIYPKFVCNRVYKLDHVQDEREKRKLGGILSYITHLIKFKDKHSMEGVSSSSKGHKIPSLLFQKFSSMFSDDSGGSKKQLAKDKLDLLISYVLVLSLFVDDFRSDPLDIAGDLRMSLMKLREYYELLGCKLVRGENQVLLATLPAPLHFTTKNKRRKRY